MSVRVRYSLIMSEDALGAKPDRSHVINLTPFLLFDGNCAEAMTFYQSCLNGELTITKIEDTPMKNHMPPQQHHKVAHAHLKSSGIEFSATDWLHPKREPKPGNTVAMYI